MSDVLASSTHPAVCGMESTEEVGCSEVHHLRVIPKAQQSDPQGPFLLVGPSHKDPQEEAVRQESLTECTRTVCDHKHFTQTIYFIYDISVMSCLEYCKETINFQTRKQAELSHLSKG